MSTIESWGVNRHTSWCTSPVGLSVVSQCKLAVWTGVWLRAKEREISATVWATWLGKGVIFRSGTDLISLLILLSLFLFLLLFLLGELFKNLRLRRFKSDRDKIWQDCSSSKCSAFVSSWSKVHPYLFLVCSLMPCKFKQSLILQQSISKQTLLKTMPLPSF